jgi:hypothetical protein
MKVTQTNAAVTLQGTAYNERFCCSKDLPGSKDTFIRLPVRTWLKISRPDIMPFFRLSSSCASTILRFSATCKSE